MFSIRRCWLDVHQNMFSMIFDRHGHTSDDPFISLFPVGCRNSAGSDTYTDEHATLYFTPNLIHIKQLKIIPKARQIQKNSNGRDHRRRICYFSIDIHQTNDLRIILMKKREQHVSMHAMGVCKGIQAQSRRSVTAGMTRSACTRLISIANCNCHSFSFSFRSFAVSFLSSREFFPPLSLSLFFFSGFFTFFLRLFSATTTSLSRETYKE